MAEPRLLAAAPGLLVGGVSIAIGVGGPNLSSLVITIIAARGIGTVITATVDGITIRLAYFAAPRVRPHTNCFCVQANRAP
jgi:hypothetical protein